MNRTDEMIRRARAGEDAKAVVEGFLDADKGGKDVSEGLRERTEWFLSREGKRRRRS